MEVSHSNIGHEANNIIMKITTGLQSNNLGLQCEAIAEYPNIVKKYPFPVVISPIFVQIIEAFRKGPNYLRLIVLKSCNACLEHIGKLTCAEDIVFNLSREMESNDPCARSLCLKLLGILHPIFSSNKSVHHMIILCLDSHYDIELNAAIEASNSYAPISKEFANGLCQKLCVKLESLSTDLHLKIQLIKLARCLHHKTETIEETRTCLISLLNRYRSLEFVINIVDTLTMLTTRSPTYARSLVDLLIEQIQIEDREPVVLAILNNKLILARHMSHNWSEDHISFLCHLYNRSDPIKKSNLIANCKIIEILSILAESSCPASIFTNEKSKNPILILIIECASAAALIESDFNDVVYRINYFGIKLLGLISAATGDVELAEHTLNTFYVNVGNHWQKPHCDSHTYIFQCNAAILKLLNEFPDLFTPFLTKNISYLLEEINDGKHTSNFGFSLFCRFMTKFCFNLPIEVNDNLPNSDGIIDLLHTSKHQRSPDQYLSICSFVFQLVNCEGGMLISEENSSKMMEWLVKYNPDNWLLYRIGRMANRYNQHKIASAVYKLILPSVISPQYIYWIRGLIEISEAESLLMSLNDNESNKLIDVILSAQKHFYQSTNSFKCSGASLWWADAYVKIRCQFLNAVYILVVTLNQYGSKFNTKNMKLSALNENKSLFKSNIAQITNLINKSIDADDATIKQLQWLKQLSSLFLQTLQNYNAYVDNSFTNKNSHQDYWVKRLCEEISTNFKNSADHQDDNQLIVDKMRLLMTLSTNAVKIGVPFPRYLFQKLQNTEVRLMAVVNGKTIANEPVGDIPLRQDQSHKLQVFGIIQQHYKTGKPIRIVNRVQISISLVLNPSSKIVDNSEKPILVVDNIVKLNNDYFTSHVLLDLKKCSPVKYQLIMKASPIDTSGVKWETREVSSCIVKVESLTNGILSKSQIIR